MRPFNWHIYILPWPILNVSVKIMHISIGDIFKMVADTVGNTFAIKYDMLNVDFRLLYLELTLTSSKGQLECWNGVSPNILALVKLSLTLYTFFMVR